MKNSMDRHKESPLYAWLAASLVILFLLHAAFLNGIAEDAFITFRFSHNVAAGNGAVWNAAEPPVEGFTSFLWMVFCALIIRLGLDVEFFSQIAGVASAVGALWLTYRCGRDVFSLSRAGALLPCLMLAVAGPFATWATSGMEMSFFGLLVMASCYVFCRYLREHGTGQLAAAFALMFIGTLTRPEGMLMFVLAIGALLVDVWIRRSEWRHVLLAATIFSAPFLIYFFWRYAYFGYPLPNTFYAKTGGGLPQVLRGVKYTALFALYFLAPFLPLVAIRVWDGGHLEKDAGKRMALAYFGVLAALYSAYIVAVGGDYMAMFRFFMPILPIFYLLIGFAIEPMFRDSSLRRKFVAASLLMAAIGGILSQSTPLEARLFRLPEFMLGTYRGVGVERWNVNRNRVLGEFLRSKIGPGDSVSFFGIGVKGYIHRDRPVRSMTALVDSEMAHMQLAEQESGYAGHEKVDLLRVLREKPTVVLLDTDLAEFPGAELDYVSAVGASLKRPEVQEILSREYVPRWEWVNDPLNNESGYVLYHERSDRALGAIR